MEKIESYSLEILKSKLIGINITFFTLTPQNNLFIVGLDYYNKKFCQTTFT